MGHGPCSRPNPAGFGPAHYYAAQRIAPRVASPTSSDMLLPYCVGPGKAGRVAAAR